MLFLLLQVPQALLNEFIYGGRHRWRNRRRSHQRHWWRRGINHIFGTGVVQMLLLLQSKLALVVAEVVTPKKERKLSIVLLFLHGHLFKLGSISSDKLSQLVNDVPQLLIFRRIGDVHVCSSQALVTK